MDKIGSRSGGQYLPGKTDNYRYAIQRTRAAYHRCIQMVLISQGVFLCVAATIPALVLSGLGGARLCTIKPAIPPSEWS